MEQKAGGRMKQLYTKWGRKIDPEHVLPEYPRPLLVRENYTNLNGYWEYAFTEKFREPEKYEGRILVPFSPESALSGVSRQLKPDEYLWYRRRFRLEKWRERKNRRLLLHFGAVDQACRVFVNGQPAARHTGGYLPFSADITELAAEGENELVVAVKDLTETSYHARGKQRLRRGGMFYTAQSGIWQTVWMEEVPGQYITNVNAEPDTEKGVVHITVEADVDRPVEIRIQKPRIYEEPIKLPEDAVLDCTQNGEDQEILCSSGRTNKRLEIKIENMALWTCETPYLYPFTVVMGEDRAESYFAMRRFSVERDEKGILRICLNGVPVFQNGVLDQGYWPEGLYTAPSDEALIFDIREMKKTGFNMVRKHLKIEPQRWYYHCDRLGLIVWQDMVNGGGEYKRWFVTYAATVLSWRNIKIKDAHPALFGRKDRKGMLEFVREMKETIRILKGHPAIAVWVIFNEGWGQFQTEKMTEIVRKLDPSRLIDPASGWFDQGGGDLKSIHNYFFKLQAVPDEKRAVVLSETGGYTLRMEGHSACEKRYGYSTYKEEESLNRAYKELMEKVEKLIPDGLCACIYTQWSDIEEEINGVYTYDREIRKIMGPDL